MSSSPDPSPAHTAIGIPHILRAIIAACDSPTVAALARTSKWVREVINDDNPRTRYLHVGIQDCDLKRRVRKDADCPKMVAVEDTATSMWEDLFSSAPNDELQNTVLDLSGIEHAEFIKMAQERGLFPNVVRLMVWLKPGRNGSDGKPATYYLDYPKFMPRARCVVAFPYYRDAWWDDGVHGRKSRSLCPSFYDAGVLNDREWVFDRIVYHPQNPTAREDWLLDEEQTSPTIPILPPAWHTAFLVPRTCGATWEARLLERIAHVSAIALLRRTFVAGAHVTIVTDATDAITTHLHPAFHRRILQRGREQSLKRVFRQVVISFLTKESLMEREFDEEFTVRAIGAIKLVSWAQYQASITPRQFELETIQ